MSKQSPHPFLQIGCIIHEEDVLEQIRRHHLYRYICNTYIVDIECVDWTHMHINIYKFHFQVSASEYDCRSKELRPLILQGPSF